MDVNLTLVGQTITFILFVWFTMKFIWPRLMTVLEERRTNIADGLAAAEKGRNELELAEIKAKEQLTEAKNQAALIIEKANHRANRIIEDAKAQARVEGDRLIKMAEEDIEREYQLTKQQLLDQVSVISVAAAQKILKKEINPSANDDLVKQLISEIE